MKTSEIYTLQGYKDESIIAEKQANKDYKVQVTQIDDDGELINIVVDGNHSLEAAKRDNVEPEIEIVENQGPKSLEQYVVAFNDLSNPVNIDNGIELW